MFLICLGDLPSEENDLYLEELSKIMKLQIESSGWKLNDDVTEKFINDIIRNNKNCFSGNGGDTKNLLDKCKIANARRVFTENTIIDNEVDNEVVKKRRKGRKFYSSPSQDPPKITKITKLLTKGDIETGLKHFIESKKENDEIPESIKMMWT